MNYVDIAYSKDGGYTWSDWRKIPMGTTGQFMRRIVARRFGLGYQFTFKVRITDNVRADILGASAQLEPTL